MDDRMNAKDFISGLMKENNDIIKSLIPKSTSEEINGAISTILNDLGVPPAPAQELPARRRYSDIQVSREINNILHDLG